MGTMPVVAQKKPKPPEPESWPCQLTLRDAVDASGNPVDAINSDGQGTYVHGEDGGRVSCRIVHAPGTAHDGWLASFIDATSVRYMNFPGQSAHTSYTRSGYNTFENRGSFEVKFIRDATIVGQTYLKAFRAYVSGPQFTSQARLMGDSFALAPADRFAIDLRGTSSLFVVPLDDCTWQVTSNPTYPITAGEGASLPRQIGLIEYAKGNTGYYRAADFVLSFSATVRVIGVKPGCGAP
jgi:hypothetical protein